MLAWLFCGDHVAHDVVLAEGAVRLAVGLEHLGKYGANRVLAGELDHLLQRAGGGVPHPRLVEAVELEDQWHLRVGAEVQAGVDEQGLDDADVADGERSWGAGWRWRRSVDAYTDELRAVLAIAPAALALISEAARGR